MNLVEIFTKFPKQEDCIAFLEEKRWHNKTVCPYCGSCKSSKESGLRHHCNKCNTSYSVLVNTIFHHTHLPLQKWFLAISLIVNAKKGISSRQLARDIKVTKDTAWRMQMQIRQAMVETPSLMTGICEMDETYIGGKSKGKRKGIEVKRGRGTQKIPVVGVVSRDLKHVKAQVLHKISFADLKKVVENTIDLENAILITDDYTGYIPFKDLIKHESVNHSKKEYVRGNIYTNTIEGFWATLKRGIVGQYHYLSDKYLAKYANEFCFKYNNRNNKNIFDLLLNNSVKNYAYAR